MRKRHVTASLFGLSHLVDLEAAPPRYSGVRISVGVGVSEAYAYVAQISAARRDFIALREIFLERIATTKALIEAMDARIREHDQRFPGWKSEERVF